MKTALLSLASALALFAVAPAHAVNAEDAVVCAAPRPVTARLVSEAGDLQSIAGRPDILVGHLSASRDTPDDAQETNGAVLFLKHADGWRAVLPQNGENEVGVYTAPGALVLITQLQTEGPGQSFTVVRTGDNFATATCATLPFPDALNKPTWNMEYLTPHDLDIDARGRGLLVASAALERNGEAPRTLWYSYATRDNGRTWRAAKRIGGQRSAPAGLFTPAATADAPALVADLRAYAQSR